LFRSRVTVDKSQENFDSLGGGKGAVELTIGLVGFLVASKDANHFLHK